MNVAIQDQANPSSVRPQQPPPAPRLEAQRLHALPRVWLSCPTAPHPAPLGFLHCVGQPLQSARRGGHPTTPGSPALPPASFFSRSTHPLPSPMRVVRRAHPTRRRGGVGPNPADGGRHGSPPRPRRRRRHGGRAGATPQRAAATVDAAGQGLEKQAPPAPHHVPPLLRESVHLASGAAGRVPVVALAPVAAPTTSITETDGAATHRQQPVEEPHNDASDGVEQRAR